MTTAPDRRHRLEGVYNLRDLGGLPTEDGSATCTGRIFRSDSLQSLTPAGAATLYNILGIRLLLDLRGEEEVMSEGRGLLAERAVQYVNLPILQEDGTLISFLNGGRSVDLVPRYLSYLESPDDPLVRAIELLSEADTMPTVFFCAAGKDRTGVLSALVLRLVGVTREAVVDDYLLSAESTELILRERLMPSPTYAHNVATLPREVYTAEASTMARFLAALEERYGSPEGWALQKGLTPDMLTRLRVSLLGGDGASTTRWRPSPGASV